MSVGLLLTFAASTLGLAPVHVGTLPCGGGTFRLLSQKWADRKRAPLAPHRQSLSVERDGRARTVALDRTALVVKDGFAVRNRYVASWACLTNARGDYYAILGYACAIDRGYPHDCGGEREWLRFLDDRGRAVDRGVPQDGPAADALKKRLGLFEQFTHGVQMSTAVEDD